MIKKRGKNRDTIFDEWWNNNGAYILGSHTKNKSTPYVIIKSGFMHGWVNRHKRDISIKEKKK